MLLFALAAGCSSKAPATSYTLHSVVTPCPPPPPLELAPLDPEKALGHPTNMARLTLNIDLLTEQLSDLYAVINCYETQAELKK